MTVASILAFAVGCAAGPMNDAAWPERASVRVVAPADVKRIVLEAVTAGANVATMDRALLGSDVSATLASDGTGHFLGQIFLPPGSWDLYATALDAAGAIVGRGKATTTSALSVAFPTAAKTVSMSILDWNLWAGAPVADPEPDPGPIITGLDAPRAMSLAALQGGSSITFTVTAVDPDGGTVTTAPSALTYWWSVAPLPGADSSCAALTFSAQSSATTGVTDPTVESCLVTVTVTERSGASTSTTFEFVVVP